MSTKEQSATLLRLNKQEQVKALQAVGFAYRIAGHAGGM